MESADGPLRNRVSAACLIANSRMVVSMANTNKSDSWIVAILADKYMVDSDMIAGTTCDISDIFIVGYMADGEVKCKMERR